MRKTSLLILSSASLAALASVPAFAQTPAPGDTTGEQREAQAPANGDLTNAQGESTEGGEEIIVTGSRIRRDNYSTPQNVDILTRDDQILAGARSTTETLQSATVTSGTSQISGSFLGYLSEGGQGANVVGLRGLGSTRTLVLLNGRRLAPAGVGPQLVSADLNVLPTAMVQRVEVLREGASSVYGSDAIAGVINIITDTKMNGITADLFVDVPVYANAGQTYRGSITAGKTFSGGHITASFEYREDRGLRLGDREDLRCPRELAFVNGVEVGQGSPDDPTRVRCFPFERQAQGTANAYGLAYTGFTDGPDLLGFGFLGRLGLRNGGITSLPLNVDNYDLRPTQPDIALRGHVISPTKTYTGYVNAAYDLDFLGDVELYGEALFNRRETFQDNTAQINFQNITNFGEAQLYGGNFTDYFTGASVPCAAVMGSACSPFYPTAWADSGANYFGPFIMPRRLFRSSQKVDYFRANGGLRGNTGIGDWRFDANVMVSRTWGEETLVNPLTERMNNILVAVAAPANTPSQYITRGVAGQVGAGNAYTCASNVTAGAYNGGTCVPINIFDPAVFANGQLSEEFYNYVYRPSTTRTRYNQETYSLSFDGSLFNLPGGAVQAAIGVEHRRDHIDDKPSPERIAGTLYGYGTAARTVGSDSVTEVFGELRLPILANRPFFHSLELSGAARYTDYESYGSDVTYSFRGEWAPVEYVRFRGNYGTNFRAPNLYEQFVADEVGFYPGGLDPCEEFGTALSPSTQRYKNCLAELTPILDNPATPANEALGYFTSGSIQVTTTGGRGQLDAEKATTWGLGTVLRAPREWGDFSLAVDYWNVEVRGQVATLGNIILDFCYDADDFPNNEYCNFIDGRVTDSSDPAFGQISSFRNPYLNIARQRAQGIDFDARYATDLFGGRFSTQFQATRMIKQQLEYFTGDGLNDFNGQLGYPGAGAGPKWVGSLDTRLTLGDVTFRWGVEYVGKAQDEEEDFYLTATGDACTAGTAGCQLATFDLTAEPYWEHGFSIQWRWPEVAQFTLGINNAFNEKPPTISAHPTSSAPRLGNYFANGPYDYRGRSVFLNVTRSF